MFKAYKVRLYPTKAQSELIDKTIGCCRFIYNAMLIERTEFYTQNKGDKKILATHKYTTIKEYRSVELIDYKHGEDVRPVRLVYQAQGNFVEVLKDTLGGSWA